MTNHLLHLDTSIRTEGSRSRQLSARVAERWRTAHPGGTVTYRDLAREPLPHLDEASLTFRFTDPAEHTPEQAAAQALNRRLVDEVVAADTILIGLPLYNFGVPSTFRAWFDRIVDPDLTVGRMGGKRILVVTARGGGYGPGTPREGWDHREPWLRHALEFLGADAPTFVHTELTLARESPAMAELDLGGAEDASWADATAAVDALF